MRLEEKKEVTKLPYSSRLVDIDLLGSFDVDVDVIGSLVSSVGLWE